jgi:hypothetical protein
MIKMICEKTGIEFEAENRRRKSHPVVQAWLAQAYEEGWYQQANDAIYGSSARSVEKQTFTTIEQFVAYFEQLRASALQEKQTRETADSQQKREREEARRQRHITNSLLSGRGYTWKKYTNDEEDIDMLGMPAVEWDLRSPDNRIVSVQEAMQELAYQDVKFAHEWLAAHNIAEQVPAIEKKRKAQEVERAEYTEEQIDYQQEAIPAFIEAGLTPEDAEREAKRLSFPHAPWEDNIRLEPVRLPDTDAALVINGDFRYGVVIGDEWCGINEIMKRYPNVDLSEYAERNRKRAS